MKTPKVTVAWCKDCMHHTEEADIGSSCPSMDCPRTMIKRVGYLCQEPIFTNDWPCSMLHWTVSEMKECQHDAY